MKHVVISGTSRGIGYELALKFANSGHKVLAISRKVPQALAAHENVTCLPVDLSAEADFVKISDFIQKWSTVDAVVHNAGALIHKPFELTLAAEFEYIYKVNVFAVAELNRILLPYMQKGSHVVSLSSMGGIQGSVKFAGLSAYSSSKAALIGLTELLAEEYKDRGISFNVLALGAVQTEMLADAFPGYQAPISAAEMSDYIFDFALNGQRYYNGKILQVSSSTP